MNALNCRAIIAGVILVAAVLAFTSLGYTAITVLHTTTESEWSLHPHTQTLTQNCCFTIFVTLPQPSSILLPFGANYTLAPTPYTVTSFASSQIIYTTTQTFSNVPASEAIGLSPTVFTMLAVIVIGFLALLTAWFILKSRTKPNGRAPN